MRNKHKAIGIGLLVTASVAGAVVYLHGRNFGVLSPAGTIAAKEKHLIVIASLLSLLVVIPVFALLFGFAYKYRETNKKPQKYTPEADGSRLLETIWWLVPTALIAIISIMGWQSSHTLDPYKPIVSNQKPVIVQVVAMDWKWLFIYPQEHIATINYLPMPINTPVNFQLTSDAPMNSFWIPQLGGQVYAMTGMSTQLHLMATKSGNYRGLSANISGVGFSGMKFTAHVGPMSGYDDWVQSVRNSSPVLDQAAYAALAKPSLNNLPSTYALGDDSLYTTIIAKYTSPQKQTMGTQTTMGNMSSMQGMTQ